MKKSIILFLSLIFTSFVFGQSFRISDSEFNIEGTRGLNLGKTNKTSLLMRCPLDTNTVFSTKEEFEKYIAEYKQSLVNTRAFETIEMSYESILDEISNIYNIKLIFNLVDSNHFLALPYPKYSSNDGATLKLKIKDTNFLGSLNPLSTDLTFNYNDSSNEWYFGVNFSYDYPFKAGIFNATWSNRLNLGYTIGDSLPVLFSGIGVSFSLPKNFFSINFGISQNINYNAYDSGIWEFSENLSFSTPITLFKAPNYSSINYSPYVSFDFNWDQRDFIRTVPFVDHLGFSFGHSLSNSKVNWNDNFRKGYSLSLSNSFSYLINKKPSVAVPSFSLQGMLFTNFKLLDKTFLNRMGINSRLYAFTVVEMPNRGDTGNQYVGGRLRGIIDSHFPASPCGIVLNLDIPIQIITTNFPYDLFNFTMQFSPFFDIALTQDPSKYNFNFRKISYTTGFEILVYPKKFSSYTIRGSIGFDIKSAFKESNKFKGLWHNKEIYIGLDLHY